MRTEKIYGGRGALTLGGPSLSSALPLPARVHTLSFRTEDRGSSWRVCSACCVRQALQGRMSEGGRLREVKAVVAAAGFQSVLTRHKRPGPSPFPHPSVISAAGTRALEPQYPYSWVGPPSTFVPDVATAQRCSACACVTPKWGITSTL